MIALVQLHQSLWVQKAQLCRLKRQDTLRVETQQILCLAIPPTNIPFKHFKWLIVAYPTASKTHQRNQNAHQTPAHSQRSVHLSICFRCSNLARWRHRSFYSHTISHKQKEEYLSKSYLEGIHKGRPPNTIYKFHRIGIFTPMVTRWVTDMFWVGSRR